MINNMKVRQSGKITREQKTGKKTSTELILQHKKLLEQFTSNITENL